MWGFMEENPPATFRHCQMMMRSRHKGEDKTIQRPMHLQGQQPADG